MKEEIAKAGLQWNLKKTKIMATEKLHYFSTGSEDIEIVKGFCIQYLGSILNPNADLSQEIRRLRVEKIGMKELEKIIK